MTRTKIVGRVLFSVAKRGSLGTSFIPILCASIYSKHSLPNNHPCTLPCHAPSSCPETEPCQSLIMVSCPCGRIKQAVACNRTSTSTASSSTYPQLKCTTECAIAKRNARLAEALGIDPDKDKTSTTVYTDELCGFANSNPKFLSIVEKAFAECVCTVFIS